MPRNAIKPSPVLPLVWWDKFSSMPLLVTLITLIVSFTRALLCRLGGPLAGIQLLQLMVDNKSTQQLINFMRGGLHSSVFEAD